MTAYARNAGLRIDHLLLTPDLTKHLKRAEVDTEVRGWENQRPRAGVERVEKCEGEEVMARRPKTFINNIVFFELALAAPYGTNPAF